MRTRFTQICKKVMIAISLTALIGCGSGPAIDGEVVKNQFKSSDVSFLIPTDWETFTEFSEGYPDSALFVAQNNVKNKSFVANLSLSYSMLDSGTDASKFAETMLQTHKDTLIGFKERSKQDIQITVNGNPASTVLNVFEGKQTIDSPKLLFYQTYAYKGETMYILTGTTHLDDDRFVKEKLEKSVKTLEIIK